MHPPVGIHQGSFEDGSRTWSSKHCLARISHCGLAKLNQPGISMDFLGISGYYICKLQINSTTYICSHSHMLIMMFECFLFGCVEKLGWRTWATIRGYLDLWLNGRWPPCYYHFDKTHDESANLEVFCLLFSNKPISATGITLFSHPILKVSPVWTVIIPNKQGSIISPYDLDLLNGPAKNKTYSL